MRLVVQRVKSASVAVEGKTVGSIKNGYFVLVGIDQEDDEGSITRGVDKLLKLRVMPDEKGIMNINIIDAEGEILLVSQFTLLADTSQRRPSFLDARIPAEAKVLFNHFAHKVQTSGLKAATGVFGAYMVISSVNDGPVTIILDT